ncbi:Ornithine carbamoyltransferase [Candidatus Hydrogenisulfobacillus filiaventi]|uniref:Ornithine carbamoyltransferase n=1 Tax=Candidatus Hydrogenisulfobacillus filiaventi TaxID=2707344 RepID=A0A6F8ZKB8_9FIRM|nr:ornithine carbamoyltransferase [Bacillota bacterium]CAB1129903.1 Ornithine carbamoyltransferase [Candidatus Hydrogenisulfobacillus filiaventi]
MVERTVVSDLNLLGRSVLALTEWAPEEIRGVLATARWMKQNREDAHMARALAGKTVALLFELPSTRTRVSFQVAAQSLGAHVLTLGWNELQLGRGEPVRDTARVLSRYVDAVVIRARSHATVQEFIRYATVPVFNALTDQAHPFQVLADALTLWETQGSLSGLTFTYVGDGNNMANSYLTIGAKLGWHVRLATPAAYRPDAGVFEWARREAELTGGSVTWTEDPAAAVEGADAVATDVWVSMADPESEAKRLALAPYQVNASLMSLARPSAAFLHCLPAHRGEEVTEEVLEGPQSVVFEEAENRLWVEKSALYHCLV